jgi:pimeloyl-ACP methyl ester carboxylesterase
VSVVTVGEENSSAIELYYEDLGAGSPVVLLAGYPFTGTAWEKQIPALIAAGHRVITLDRRGFGRSSRPSVGYDFDTLADDLDALLNHLRLTEVSLAGWSMGTGEIIRYIGKHGVSRVRKIALLGTMGPFWLKTADNPDGADASMFEGFQTAMRADRPATMLNIVKTARNHDVLGGTLVSDAAINEAWNVAVAASPIAAVECFRAWMTDFRADIPKITVPTLIVHAGDTDRVLPPDISSRKLVKLIPGARLVEIEGGPHDILWTHPDVVNEALVGFLR